MSNDFVFRGSVADLDPDIKELLERERERQEKTIILIPSESAAPAAVEEAMGSKFGNIYAEGYPRESSRQQTQAEITDIEQELALYRRNSDPRYYKGVEYADMLEALTRRRAAELFAANGITADQLFVNVQPLSGGPANSQVYTALLEPGDTIMGLNLADGGHLSHGAPVNRSGKIYHSVSYYVDSETEKLDYDAIEKQALEVKPKIIVAGFSAYPLIIDWQRFREIADKVGAYFHADIAHISGLVAAGVHPSPIGIADTVMTTTHKSLCGPRGAIIMTHRKDLASKIDKAVFPGEQGGGHFNTIGALAVALKLANTDQFRQLQQQIVRNASRLADQLSSQGLRIVSGGSQNHLLLIDCRSITNGKTGDQQLTLDGDMAARILDVAGIVTNRNTIPGDRSALYPSGVRIGTVWITQLGFKEPEIDKLALAIATLLKGSVPFEYPGSVRRRLRRAKVNYDALQQARELVRLLTKQPAAKINPQHDTLRVRGEAAGEFLELALTSDVGALVDGGTQAAYLYINNKPHPVMVHRGTAAKYYLRFADGQTAHAAQNWLRDLSDGYVLFDPNDVYAKLPGPVTVETRTNISLSKPNPESDLFANAICETKPYFVGQHHRHIEAEALPEWSWAEPEAGALQQTVLYETHKAAGARMVPFSGYDMPVWYSSVGEEHAAVRSGAALFDISHMGVFSVTGPHARAFLDAVTTNDVGKLEIGRSQYAYLLAPDGKVLDDLMIYRTGEMDYMMVVNAGNNDKDWGWLNAVNDGKALLDCKRPWVRLLHKAELRDLRQGENGHILIALQGPKSADVLAAAARDEELAKQLKRMAWASLQNFNIGGKEYIISRSGYTGERVGFEIFVDKADAPALWQKLVAAGATQAGLAARDSTRTEAGLPLYGHELSGPHAIDPDTACFGMYVKLWKPFFIGREPYINTYESHPLTIVRFQMDDKAVRRPEQGDPIIDKRGKVVGVVTSCGIGSDGYLVGMALVPLEYRRKGAQLQIYQTGGGTKAPNLPKEMGMGAKMPRPDTATVLTRFPSGN